MQSVSLPKHEPTLIGGGVTLDHVFAEILQLKADVAALRADHTLTQVHLRNYFSQQQQHQQQPAAATTLNAPVPVPTSTAAAAAEPVTSSTSAVNSTSATHAPTSTTTTTTNAKKRKASQDSDDTASPSVPHSAAKPTKKACALSKSVSVEPEPKESKETAEVEKQVTVIKRVERRGRPRKASSTITALAPVSTAVEKAARKPSILGDHDMDTVSEGDDSSDDDDNVSEHNSNSTAGDSDAEYVASEKPKNTPKINVRAAKKKKLLPETDNDDDNESDAASNASDAMDVDKPAPKKRVPRKAAGDAETPKKRTTFRKTVAAEPVVEEVEKPMPASCETSPKKRDGASKQTVVAESVVATALLISTTEESAAVSVSAITVGETNLPQNHVVQSLPNGQSPAVAVPTTPVTSVSVPAATATASAVASITAGDPFDVPLDDEDVKPSPNVGPRKKTKASKKAIDPYDVDDAKDSNTVRTPNDPNSGWHFNLKYGAEVEAYSKQYKAWYLGKILYYIALPGNKYKIKIHYVGYSKQFDEVFDISSVQGRSLLRPYKNKKLSLGLKADETVPPTQWDPNGKQPYGLESDVTREGELFIQKE
ncbi:UNVERIFIED_CONTAM: hypothetical protein HDU68_004586 [Siphonaria sp. JEL0065]|nr:hypothetical protein HDU68_004586 [Siphonaria sp. JEL0065]